MLKPEQIKEKEFQTTGRGSYRAEDVDAFLSEVNDSYDGMFKANAELVKKISVLANKVEEYRNDEESLKSALIAAQKLADKIVKEANEKAETVLNSVEAKAKSITDSAADDASKMTSDAKKTADSMILDAKKEAEEILGAVNRKVTQESLAFDMLQKESSNFRNKLIGMYKQHLTLINELPALAEEKLKETEEKAQSAEKETETDADESSDENNAEAVEEETVTEVFEEIPVNSEAADDNEQFSLIDEEANDFEDVSSSTDEGDVGFSLNVSAADFDDDDIEAAESPLAGNYAPIDETPVASDSDDDDEPVSFKSFFKKK